MRHRVTDDKLRLVRELLMEGRSTRSISIEVGVAQSTVTRVRMALGISPFQMGQRMPAPDDFVERYEAMPSIRALASHYGVAGDTVTRWIVDSGLERPATNKTVRKEPPPEWREVAPTMTRTQIAQHWRVCPKVIARWIRETGVHPRSTMDGQTMISRMGRRTTSISAAHRTATDVDHAAHFLRRHFPVVHKADIKLTESGRETWGSKRGLPYGGKDLYNVDGKIVPVREMLALAEERGWRVW